MAFEDKGDISRLDKDMAPKGHGQRLTGTLMSALMGQGYREPGESHMLPIMDAWERFSGLGRRSRKTSKAMEVGVTMEEVAYARAAELLRMQDIGSENEAYETARLYEAHRGLYLENEASEGEYGFAANIDGALIDVSGEYADPRTGDAISGRQYAERQALEVALHERIREDNEILVSDGELPMGIPEAKYTQKLPWMGTADIKVTMAERVLEENRLKGIPGGWVVQVHHYNKMLREDNEKKGASNVDYPNLMGIYQYCTAIMDGYFHEVEFDPELEAEMARRADLFIKCVEGGISPNSSAMASYFYEYPVKRPEPKAMFLSAKMEQKFSTLLDKRDAINGKISELEGFRDTIDESLKKGFEGLNRRMGGTTPKAFFVKQEKGVSLLDYRASITNRSRLDEVGVNQVLDSAASAKSTWEKSQAVWQDASLSPEDRLTHLAEIHQELGSVVASVPATHDSSPIDLEMFKSKVKVESKQPKIKVSNNKKIKAIYEREIAQREAENSVETSEHQHQPESEERKEAPETTPQAANDTPKSGTDAQGEQMKDHPGSVSESRESTSTQHGQMEGAEPQSEKSAIQPEVGEREGYTSEPYDLKEPVLPDASEPASEPGTPKQEAEDTARQHADDIGLPMQFPSM